jgi:sugar lactone lactonase YvrE
MSARQQKGSVRVAGVIVLALCGLLLACPSAFATVKHKVEASFNGSEIPEENMFADAVDDSSGLSAGDLYVASFEAVDKFEPDGTYTGVQITGAETPQGSFALFSGSLAAGGVAVDGSSGVNAGDVYVSDMENGVVDKFKENGEFDCQITAKTPGSPAEVEHECARAVGSATPDGSIEPAGITVDKATGDVWVADRAHAAIDEFNSSGEYVGQITDPHIVTPGPIALDSAGNLYVTNASIIIENEPPANDVVVFHEGKFVRILDEHRPLSAAVDPSNNHVYVFESEGRTLAEYDAAGNLIDRFVERRADVLMGSIAVSSDGHVYGVETYPTSPAFVVKYGPDVTVPTVTTEPATEVKETAAILHGSVDPDALHGGGAATSCEFEYVTREDFEAHGFEGAAKAACVPAVPLSSPESVSAAVTLVPSTTYEYRLTASNTNGVANHGVTERLATLGTPIITDKTLSTLTSTGVTLAATIDSSGFEADCHVEYVTEASFEVSGFTGAATQSCTPAEISATSTQEHVTVAVTGLVLSTTYHARFVSTNSAGTTHGADQTFKTFGIKSFAFEVLDQSGNPYTQAGGHPYEWTTSFELNTTPTIINSFEHQAADGNIRNVETELPPGLIASAAAVPRCPRYLVALDQCSPGTQVGEIEVVNALGEHLVVGLYNVVPPEGVPLELGAVVANLVRVYIDGNVQTGGEYRAIAKVLSTSSEDNIKTTRVTIWGTPEDPSHNSRRVCPVFGEQVPVGHEECSPAGPPVPFLTNPTSCPGQPLVASLRMDTWQDPGQYVAAKSEIPATTGCAALDFTPSITVAPDTAMADSPSGLDVNLEVPQNETESGLATSSLENTTVELPAGVSVSPSAANGLEACSEAQIGLHNSEVAQCPNGSKIGTVEITSPLLTDRLTGSVYVARQGENPFHSLLAMYIAAEADGARVKLAGHIVADPVTGQLTTTFTETPQIPFNDFKLNLFGGRRGALATPNACGAPNTNVSLTPWDGLGATSFSEPFTTSTGCVSGFSPSFEAGTVSAQAGAYAPFTLSFSRGDSEENFAGATVTLPPGLIGKIAGVAQCSDAQLAAAAARSGVAEQASPSCPAGSLIGTVQTTAGPGPSPVSVSGKAYLIGPYKGGPYGIAVIVPAVAGPYDLGTVVIRQSLRIDPSDAHVTDTSDPFPTILQGVPLRIKSVNVTLDRPGFTFNPTSCEAKTINATLESTGGAKAGVSSHFQAANCATLKFAPKFSASTAGKASKANGASLDVKVGYPTGPEGTYANIKAVKVDLPKQLPSRLTTLQKACLAATFDTNPANCPKASNVGTATATTPVLNVPLIGPAYIVSHGGEAFPDLEIVLQGENVTLILVGNTQIKNGITSSTFKTIPDAPVSSFELKLPTGPFSILGANVPQSKKYNLCGQTLPMPTQITAQNGAVIKQTTKIAVTGCPKAKKAKARKANGKVRHERGKGQGSKG